MCKRWLADRLDRWLQPRRPQSAMTGLAALEALERDFQDLLAEMDADPDPGVREEAAEMRERHAAEMAWERAQYEAQSWKN